MNRGGVGGNLASIIMSVIIILLILPFSTNEFKSIVNANWLMVITASVFATLGVTFLNNGLFKATQQEVSSLFVLLIIVQVSVPVIYKIILSKGDVTIKQVLGFATAIATAILLN